MLCWEVQTWKNLHLMVELINYYFVFIFPYCCPYNSGAAELKQSHELQVVFKAAITKLCGHKYTKISHVACYCLMNRTAADSRVPSSSRRICLELCCCPFNEISAFHTADSSSLVSSNFWEPLSPAWPAEASLASYGYLSWLNLAWELKIFSCKVFFCC